MCAFEPLGHLAGSDGSAVGGASEEALFEAAMQGVLQPILAARLLKCCVPQSVVQRMCAAIATKTSAELRGQLGVAFDDVVIRKTGSIFALDFLCQELGVEDELSAVLRPAFLGRLERLGAPAAARRAVAKGLDRDVYESIHGDISYFLFAESSSADMLERLAGIYETICPKGVFFDDVLTPVVKSHLRRWCRTEEQAVWFMQTFHCEWLLEVELAPLRQLLLTGDAALYEDCARARLLLDEDASEGTSSQLEQKLSISPTDYLEAGRHSFAKVADRGRWRALKAMRLYIPTALQEWASMTLPQEVRNVCNKYGALLWKLPTR